METNNSNEKEEKSWIGRNAWWIPHLLRYSCSECVAKYQAIRDTMCKKLSLILFILIVAMTSCKDPREKTVWDYIDSELANEGEFRQGVEAFHKDLIRHGYMQDHSCDILKCASAYQNAYSDIERVASIMNEPAAEVPVTLSDDYAEFPVEDIVAAGTEKADGLDKQYSNSYFSLRYPSSWQIVQDGNQVTSETIISVQIMEKKKNDVDFRPNINIIVSSRKWTISTTVLAQQTSDYNKRMLPNYKYIGISDIQVDGCKGSLLEGSIELKGYKLRSNQYVVKKADNTTLTITATTEKGKHNQQMEVISAIMKSIQIF